MTSDFRGLPMLRAVEVHKSHGRLKVLRGASLEVAAGEVLALLGPPGAGKTTLLRCIDHLDRIDAGWIYVQGTPMGYLERRGKLREAKPRAIAAARRDLGVALVLSGGGLFAHQSVLRNLMEAPRRTGRAVRAGARDAARAALDSMGLADLEKAAPARLSAGQRQCVAIARAMLMAPNLLLLDDPTAGLGPDSADEVFEQVRRLARGGLTMVIASNDPRFLREVATTAAYLDRGAVLEKTFAQDMLLGAQHPLAQQFVAAMG
jgi:polar amino acid transport system ATP-binding protein